MSRLRTAVLVMMFSCFVVAAAPLAASAQTTSTGCDCRLFGFDASGNQTAVVSLQCSATPAACNSACSTRLAKGDLTSPDFKRTSPPSCQCLPSSCVVQATAAAAAPDKVLANANPLKGLNLQTAIGRFIKIFTGLVGSASLLMFVYGGFIYLTAGGNDDKVKKAMGVFKWTTIGLVTVFGSYAVVNGFFLQLNKSFGSFEGQYAAIYPLGQIGPEQFVGRIIRFLLGISGVVALLMFLWGGWKYFASQGDAKAAQEGQKTIINAVIGIVLIFTAYAITNFIIDLIATGLSG